MPRQQRLKNSILADDDKRRDDGNEALTTRQKRIENAKEVIPGVTLGSLRQVLALKGTWIHFGYASKDELLKNVDMKTIAQWYLSRHGKKEAIKRAEQAAGLRVQPIVDPALIEAEIERIMDTYRKAYDISTPNDEEQVRQLAYIQARLDMNRRQQEPLAMSLDPQDVKLVQMLTDDYTGLLRTFGDLQKALQIDTKGRAESRGALKFEDMVSELIDETREFVDSEILRVFHCGIEILWIWHGFPAHPWQTWFQECPRCHKMIPVNYPAEWKEKAVSAADFPIDEAVLDNAVKSGKYLLPEEED